MRTLQPRLQIIGTFSDFCTAYDDCCCLGACYVMEDYEDEKNGDKNREVKPILYWNWERLFEGGGLSAWWRLG